MVSSLVLNGLRYLSGGGSLPDLCRDHLQKPSVKADVFRQFLAVTADLFPASGEWIFHSVFNK
tara:strand:+ start:158 stop:346 length:189 start_codon:yes stop_codon:yes gene_type:complete